MLVANRKNGKIIYSKHLPKTGVPTVKIVVRLSLIALLLAGLAAPASAAPTTTPATQDDSPTAFGRAKLYPGFCLINQAVCYEPWGKAWRNW